MTLSSLILVLLVANNLVFGQHQQQQYGGRVAPGVPPQHYQPNQPAQPINTQNQQQYQQQQHQQPQQHQQQQQQQHQQQQHQQQQPQQYQQQIQNAQPHIQPQVQEQQAQPDVRLPPPARPTAPIVGTGHAHLRPHDAVFDTSNIALERDHIQEHMDLPIDTSQMTQEELMFHNFKMWDGDRDNIVDGLDLLKYLMTHLAAEDPNSATHYTDEQYADIVDQIMNNMDVNKDGITTFGEYRQSSQAYG